jgi:hypothetical protein
MDTPRPHNTGEAVKVTTVRGWTFRRASAAYIDVCPPGASGVAVDCINVYDYAAGKPTIGYTRHELRREALAWFRDHDERELIEFAALARY